MLLATCPSALNGRFPSTEERSTRTKCAFVRPVKLRTCMATDLGPSVAGCAPVCLQPYSVRELMCLTL